MAVRLPPVQVVLSFGGVARTMPAGMLSVKSSAEALVDAAVLSIVKVSVDVLPVKMDAGAKALEKIGGRSVTLSVSVAVPELPEEDVRSPVVLIWAPALEAVISTDTIQLSLR